METPPAPSQLSKSNGTRNIVLAVIAVITVALLFLVTWLGLVFVFLEIVAAAFYYRRTRCVQCGARGQIENVGTQEIGRVQGFDIFNRQETASSRGRDNYGRRTTSTSVISRQERAPSVRITYRTFYECKNCHNRTYVDSTKVEEDFSRSGNEVTKEIHDTKVVEREVLKVPCKYCRSLVDPVRNATCPSCGGRLV
jgi:uncharacterized OB-fold protein